MFLSMHCGRTNHQLSMRSHCLLMPIATFFGVLGVLHAVWRLLHQSCVFDFNLYCPLPLADSLASIKNWIAGSASLGLTRSRRILFRSFSICVQCWIKKNVSRSNTLSLTKTKQATSNYQTIILSMSFNFSSKQTYGLLMSFAGNAEPPKDRKFVSCE